MQSNSMEFQSILGRLAEGLGLDPNRFTQIQIAEQLEIRQSSISDAKRRKSIPAEWFLKALEKGGLDPEWIRTGEGPKFRLLADSPLGPLTVTELKKRIADENKRELSTEELLEALKLRFPAGTTINANFKLECTGKEQD